MEEEVVVRGYDGNVPGVRIEVLEESYCLVIRRSSAPARSSTSAPSSDPSTKLHWSSSTAPTLAASLTEESTHAPSSSHNHQPLLLPTRHAGRIRIIHQHLCHLQVLLPSSLRLEREGIDVNPLNAPIRVRARIECQQSEDDDSDRGADNNWGDGAAEEDRVALVEGGFGRW